MNHHGPAIVQGNPHYWIYVGLFMRIYCTKSCEQAYCRAGKTHDYDIVEGPVADDTVWNYVNDFPAGEISRNAFWELAKFRYPTHQISFHTMRSLTCLKYLGSDEVYE